jgi:hypothetical protein
MNHANETAVGRARGHAPRDRGKRGSRIVSAALDNIERIGRGHVAGQPEILVDLQEQIRVRARRSGGRAAKRKVPCLGG